MAEEEKDEIFPADAASSDEEVASAAYIEEGPEQENEDNAEGQEESEAKNKGEKKKGRKRNFKFRLRNPLPIIDRYILGKFLGTYFLATILLLLVIAMFDITEKLDAFLTAPLKETLFDYFASFLPYFANQLSPLFVFISVIFFTTKLADNSEIIAMLSSGITFRRLL
ncbi:MAG: LptF/LptG family permease, partial [Muribaculaceae bacterium]|nr:LptF/LptG family permease [Muribaculaceae bacterium]